jgi:hypothetical protein
VQAATPPQARHRALVARVRAGYFNAHMDESDLRVLFAYSKLSASLSITAAANALIG